jgi:hypothetical protein
MEGFLVKKLFLLSLITPSLSLGMWLSNQPRLLVTTPLKARSALTIAYQLSRDDTLDTFRNKPQDYQQKFSSVLPAEGIQAIIEQLKLRRPGVLFAATLEKFCFGPVSRDVAAAISQPDRCYFSNPCWEHLPEKIFNRDPEDPNFTRSISYNSTGNRLVATGSDAVKVWALNPNTNQWQLEDTINHYLWTSGVGSAGFCQAGTRICTVSTLVTAVWHYDWLIDKANLDQAMLCLLAQREFINKTPLNLNQHKHLIQIWQQLSPLTQQHIIKRFHVIIPLTHYRWNPLSWNTTTKAFVGAAVAGFATYGLKKWFKNN